MLVLCQIKVRHFSELMLVAYYFLFGISNALLIPRGHSIKVLLLIGDALSILATSFNTTRCYYY